MNVRLKIINGRILTPQRIIPQGTIVVEGDQIVEVREGDVDVPDALEIDAQGKYVSPGFIDLHVHGGGGCDFMDGSESPFFTIAEMHARYGTTNRGPTTLCSAKAGILQTLPLYEPPNPNQTPAAQ